MTQLGTKEDRWFRGRSRRAGRAPAVLAVCALFTVALGLGGACSGGVETDNSGSGSSATTSTGSGVDCSVVGCGAPPLCSTGCQEACGCCPCGEGEVVNDPQNGPMVCKGGCYEPAPLDGGAPDVSDDVDCSVVGCGPPPICGMACGEVCGCCNCAAGEMITVEGKNYKCTADGACYEPVP